MDFLSILTHFVVPFLGGPGGGKKASSLCSLGMLLLNGCGVPFSAAVFLRSTRALFLGLAFSWSCAAGAACPCCCASVSVSVTKVYVASHWRTCGDDDDDDDDDNGGKLPNQGFQKYEPRIHIFR